MIDRQPWRHLITEERLVDLNREVVETSGGMPSTPREGCVDGSLGAAWNAESYTAREDDDDGREGLVFAGSLLYYLARDHCFGDGNKRTALAGMQEVLGGLGLTIE